MPNVTIDLPADTERLLRAEAERRGLALPEYLRESLAELARLAAIDAGTGALAATRGTLDDFLQERAQEEEAEARQEQARWGHLSRRRRPGS